MDDKMNRPIPQELTHAAGWFPQFIGSHSYWLSTRPDKYASRDPCSQHNIIAYTGLFAGPNPVICFHPNGLPGSTGTKSQSHL
jgi:hypothetical protein